MTVNICGVPHTVIECKDSFDIDCHFGMIDYKKCEIKINGDATDDVKMETLCHEIIHGIFTHLGYGELSDNEQLVQSLGNAIYQGFDVKFIPDK